MVDLNSLPQDFYGVGPATIACVIEASRRQGVPANVLLAVSSIEGGKNGQFVRNTNGTYDVGHFQINTSHLKFFSQYGITLDDISQRGCYNAELAAWILHQAIDNKQWINQGRDYWSRAATYHSKTPRHNRRYRALLIPLAEKWGKWLQTQYQVNVVAYR